MTLRIKNTNNIIILLKYKDGIKLVYIDGYKRCCYFILVDFIVNYEEQVFIIDIKINIHCVICYILLKERKLVTQS